MPERSAPGAAGSPVLRRLNTDSGDDLPLFLQPSGTAEPWGSVLVLPALGIRAEFYFDFARVLASHGLAVVIMEQRGHGASHLRASRSCNFGFREWLVEDIPTAIAAARAEAPGQRCLLLGHSMGGHLAAMYTGLHPEQVDGLVLNAVGTPWVGAYPMRARLALRFLGMMIPVTRLLLGYYPGNRLGFGGREARQLMADWRHMLTRNRYRARGVSDDLDKPLARYDGALLSLRYADDSFASERASRAVTDKFTKASIDYLCLSASEVGGRADHYGWARSPEVPASRIATWAMRR